MMRGMRYRIPLLCCPCRIKFILSYFQAKTSTSSPFQSFYHVVIQMTLKAEPTHAIEMFATSACLSQVNSYPQPWCWYVRRSYTLMHHIDASTWSFALLCWFASLRIRLAFLSFFAYSLHCFLGFWVFSFSLNLKRYFATLRARALCLQILRK